MKDPLQSLFTIPYGEYTGPRRGTGSTSHPQNIWCFTTNGEPGVSLWKAFHDDYTGLDRAADIFFESGPEKLRFRVAVSCPVFLSRKN